MLAAEKQAAIHAAVAINVGPLVIENQALRFRVAQLSQTVLANAEELADERLRYVKEIEKLNLDNDDLRKSNDELKAEIVQLKAEIVHLKTIIADQQSKIDAQTVQIDAQTVQIDAQTVQIDAQKVQIGGLLKREKVQDAALARLMRRENLITAREAMQALEWFICVETVGKKTRVLKEKLFTIDAIEKRPELKRKLPTWVTPEVVVEMRKTKSGGSAAIHDAPFTRDEVEDAFADADPDSKALKMMMLKMLEEYYTWHSLPFGAPLKRDSTPPDEVDKHKSAFAKHQDAKSKNQLKRERKKAAKAKQDEADDLAKRNGAHVEPTAAGPPTPVVDAAPPPTAAAAPAPAADPAKKLKNLKKKIKAVDTLQARLDSGELTADQLEPEQQTKLETRVTIEDEIASLEARLAAM